MQKGVYLIADTCIEITTRYDDLHILCRDYRTEENKIEFVVETDQQDIEFEWKKLVQEKQREEIQTEEFSDGYLETLAVYRKLADKLLEKGVLLFHGSVIAVDDQGYLFTARSGTGKSTHTRLWRNKFGDRAYMVNDDKPLLCIRDNKVFAYGTPWDGKHHLSKNTVVELKAICILQRGIQNQIERISITKAFSMLMQQAYKPDTEGGMFDVMTLIEKMAKCVKLFQLHCNMEAEAAEVSWNAMKEGADE